MKLKDYINEVFAGTGFSVTDGGAGGIMLSRRIRADLLQRILLSWPFSRKGTKMEMTFIVEFPLVQRIELAAARICGLEEIAYGRSSLHRTLGDLKEEAAKGSFWAWLFPVSSFTESIVEIDKRSDFEETRNRLVRLLQQYGEPFFSRFETLQQLDHHYNSNPEAETSVCGPDGKYIGTIVAVLVGRTDIERLIACYDSPQALRNDLVRQVTAPLIADWALKRNTPGAIALDQVRLELLAKLSRGEDLS